MNKENFAEILGDIDNELIERADNVTKEMNSGNVKKSRRTLSALIASLCITAILFITVLSYFNKPHYTAMDIANLFGGMKGSATSSYQEVYVPSADYLEICPILTDTYVSIYEYAETNKEFNSSEFLSFANPIISNIEDALDKSFRNYNIIEELSYDRQMIERLTISLGESYEDHRLYMAQLPYMTYMHFQNKSNEEGMSIGKVPLEIDQTQTNEEIIDSLGPIKEAVCSIIGRDFSDVKIRRSYNYYDEHGASYIYIYFYNEMDHPLNVIMDTPLSDYIVVTFDNYDNTPTDPTDDTFLSDTILKDAEISYYQYRNDAAYSVIEKVKKISLEEAEALLYKGYTFGNHVCRMCMEAQDAVDFEEYDFVGMTYIFEKDPNMNEKSTAKGIPFYVFYKRIGTAKNGYEQYAKTYVPAIKVSGYEEYFEKQEKLHISQEELMY